MAERNEVTLIKKNPRCSTCDKKKTAQNGTGIGFQGNTYGARSLSEIIGRNERRKSSPRGEQSDSSSSASPKNNDQESGSDAGSSAASTAVGATAGGAVGAKAISPGAAAAAGAKKPSLLGRAAKMVGRTGLVALPAVGTYLGAKGLEELIGSAFAASTDLKPGIKGNLKSVMVAEAQMQNLTQLLSRMSNLSSHVDNNGMKLGAIIGKTMKEIENSKRELMKKVVNK